MEPGRGSLAALVHLIVSVATLLAVLIGILVLRGEIKGGRPLEVKGTFCCDKEEGRGGTACTTIGDDVESQERCNSHGKTVVQCTGSHIKTSDGKVTCL